MREFTVSLPQRNTRTLFMDGISSRALEISGKRALIIFDKNTEKLFPQKPFPHFIVSPGEEYKNKDTLTEIASWALSQGAGRDTVFIAVGGGVLCDVTAFLASIYMRGTNVILVPTTLLCMVDAALGGKTGIDFGGYKNILGAFFPASEVRVIPEVLKTLPEREYRSGLSEVIKHGLLKDTGLLQLLRAEREGIQKRDPDVLEEIVYLSMQVKKWYIEKDPFEQNIRGHLNLGHTFAHALESEGSFSKWTHGEAVAWGIDKAMKAGVLAGITDSAYAQEVRSLLIEYKFQLDIPVENFDSFTQSMQRDKKRKEGRIRFILQEQQGKTDYFELPDEIIRRAVL